MRNLTLLLTFLTTFSFSFGQNLIENGDFEIPGTAADPVPAPWGGFKNRIINDTTVNSFVGQIENGDGSLFQEFGVTPGDTFIVQFDYKWITSASANSVLTVRVKDATNLPTNLDLIGGTIANGFKLDETVDQWFDKATFSFVPPAGIDSVRLLFFKGNGNKPLNLDSISVILKVPCDAPTASFAIADTNDLQLQFADQSAGEGLTYQWSFGDGNSSMDPSPSHTYANPGTYEVCLTVTDTCGTAATSCQSVKLSSCAEIVAAFAVADTNNLELTFGNQSSGDELTYSWTFGDGTSSTDAEPVHSFAAAGTYEVCLTVTDTCGAMASSCDSISVTEGTSSLWRAQFPYEVSIYPNPARDVLVVSSSRIMDRVEVVSIVGEHVLDLPARDQVLTLDLSGLPGGAYFVRVHIGEATGTYKLIRQ